MSPNFYPQTPPFTNLGLCLSGSTFKSPLSGILQRQSSPERNHVDKGRRRPSQRDSFTEGAPVVLLHFSSPPRPPPRPSPQTVTSGPGSRRRGFGFCTGYSQSGLTPSWKTCIEVPREMCWLQGRSAVCSTTRGHTPVRVHTREFLRGRVDGIDVSGVRHAESRSYRKTSRTTP